MFTQCQQGTFSYAVQPGDNFYTIAAHFGISVQVLCETNPGVNPNYLQVGQVICIPQPVPTPYNNLMPDPAAQLVYGYADPPQQGPPSTPPPSYTPSEPPGLYAVDPRAISRCVFHFTYLWLVNGESFWSYLVYVGRTSVAGWRYRRGRWEYFGVDLREIRSFTCS